MTDLRYMLGLLLAVASTTVPCFAGTIDRDVSAALQAAHVNGATVEVVQNGRVVYARAFGKRDVAANFPARLDTAYEAGSITKEFTAAAILQLKEAGKIDLDAPLATYLPAAPHAKDVTIRQLLTHTSGMPEYTMAMGRGTALDDVMRRIASEPLDFEPGTAFRHSNTNYLLLGRVIEAVSGQRWIDYARARLFTAAGMNATSTIAGEKRVPKMARGYEYSSGRTRLAGPVDEAWASSAGDLVTTAGDLAKWDDALAGGRIISAEDYHLLTKSQLLADGPGSGYGFGVYLDTFDWQPRILAQGDTFGFDASDQYFPDQRTRIIVLTNTENLAISGSASMNVGEAIFNSLYPVLAGNQQHAVAGSSTSEYVKQLYADAIRTMDGLQQPAFVSYHLQGESDGEHIGLMTRRHNVWLSFGSGLAPTVWDVKHRTLDYESEVIDGNHRYVSERPFFDPTWFGAYRALRDGMLGYQNAAAPRTGLAITQAAPTPDPNLKTIGTVSVIGSGIYAVQDRGSATCSNGDPGRAMHLVSRERNPRHQLTDVVVDLRSMRFCTIRYYLNAWFLRSAVEQHYADVGGYWVVTDGFLDGSESALGISMHHFLWRYRLTNETFPAALPDATFVPDPNQ